DCPRSGKEALMSNEEKNWDEEEQTPNTAENQPDGKPKQGNSDSWDTFDWTEGFCSWEPEPQQEAEPILSQGDFAGGPPLPPEPPQSAAEKRQPKTLPESILAALIYVVGVLVISFVLATVGWRWANDLLALDKTENTVSFTVSEGDTIADVADNLKDEGLIEYKFLFQLFASVTNKADKITTGTYELNTEMDYSALLNNISSTSVYRETVTVTIPEGYTVAEAFQLLEDSGVCSVEDLTASAESDTFDYSFLEDADRTGTALLEGYLFPDTYEFYKDADAESVIKRLLSNFADQMSEVLSEENLAYDLDDVIIIASIIEKETTGSSDDRSCITSVIYNRLENPDYDGIGGYLQMDSTVQYLLEERKEDLTQADLEIDSPYNTYLYAGLPEGPICNPGMDSIEAALNPSDTDYYYFMLGDDGENHFFTESYSFNTFKAAQTGETDDEE
ncbi:MAG: endolytic transglycosylase MltG, partial [Clostridiales bacterium]|nr:endolytic transglycosylase MltG [Clostridiales bacterium]